MSTMKLGDKGIAVLELQLKLAPKYKIVADGDYGPATKRAVEQFQRDQELAVDGIAGPAVMAALKLLTSSQNRPRLNNITERLSKAWYCTTQKAKYILGEGGRNPNNPDPFTPNKDGKPGSDCIGFVLWCLGIDRYQPKIFHHYAGWMNTDSIIADAKTGVGGGLWKLLDKPKVGCLVVFPSTRKNGKLARIGHVGLVVEVPAEWPDFAKWYPEQRREMLKLVKVIDCNASFKRKLTGKAIGQLTAATLWDKPDAVWVSWVDDV